MLDVSPENLYQEIKASEKLRGHHTRHVEELTTTYTGPEYKSGVDNKYYPENHVYEYLSLTIPRLIYDNPRVNISTRRPATQGDVALAIKHGLNRWIVDTNLRGPLLRAAYDMLMSYGVILTVQKPRAGHTYQDESASFWPHCYRISPNRYIMDPIALNMEEARFMGHQWVRDKEDLLESAGKEGEGWNKNVIEAMSDDTGIDEVGRDTITRRTVRTRKEVVGYDLWIPEMTLDDSPGPDSGFHGTLYTLAINQSSKGETKADFIRDPRPYYGPRWGPYSMLGVYVVPDSPYPLSPLLATAGQMRDLNDHVLSASRSARQYKRLVLVDARSKKLMQSIKGDPDTYVIPVDGLDKEQVVQTEVGGITNQQINYIAMLRERLDRNSGIHDVQRGNISGAATATAVAVAESSTTLRVDHIKKQFQNDVTKIVKTAGWYLYHDERVSFPLGKEAADDLNMKEPWYDGGAPTDMAGMTFDDLELQIDPYSMERTNEALMQKRTMEAFSVITNAVQLMPQTPFIDWKKLLVQLGDSLNMPNLSELIDEKAMRQQMQQVAQQQQAEEAMSQSPEKGGRASRTPRNSRLPGEEYGMMARQSRSI